MSRVLFIGLAAFFVLLVSAPASAAKPCWKQVLEDWTDGKIKTTYAPSCYDDAIKNLPADVEIYSDAVDAIEAARNERLRRGAQRSPESAELGNETGTDETAAPSPADDGDNGGGQGVVPEVLNAGNRAVDDVPLPLLLLSGVALLLMAAGGAGLLSRHLKERQATPGARSDDERGEPRL